MYALFRGTGLISDLVAVSSSTATLLAKADELALYSLEWYWNLDGYYGWSSCGGWSIKEVEVL